MVAVTPTIHPGPPAVKGCRPAGRTPPYAGVASHYDTLGLTPAATHEELRQAYLARAMQHHPDRQDGRDVAARAQAERRMQVVNGAWAVLGDPDARAAYDAELGIVPHEAELEHDDGVPVAEPYPVGLRPRVRRYVPLLIAVGLIFLFLVFTAYAGTPRS